MANARTIAQVPDTLYNRVCDILVALDTRERHFNQLQGRYRSLASTWLLAAFAGMGFLFTTSLELPEFLEKVHLAIIVALAGQVGLLLLWVLDLLVYHDLLVASYKVGSDLEDFFDWVPPVRKNFAYLRSAGKVRLWIALYYLGGILILGVLAMVLSATLDSQNAHWWALLPLSTTLTMIGFISILTARSLCRRETLSSWLTD